MSLEFSNTLSTLGSSSYIRSKNLYAPQLPNAEMVVIPGVWGHFAGGGINKEDTDFIDSHLKKLLSA